MTARVPLPREAMRAVHRRLPRRGRLLRGRWQLFVFRLRMLLVRMRMLSFTSDRSCDFECEEGGGALGTAGESPSRPEHRGSRLGVVRRAAH